MQTTDVEKDRGRPTRIGLFFVGTLGFTWLLQMPALLAVHGIIAGPPERYMAPAALGGFGPILFAMVSARAESPGGVRALFGRLRIRGFGAGWYAMAILLFPPIYVVGHAAYAPFGGDAGRWLYPPENGQHLGALFLMPWVEEPGWRGYALPRLQEKHGAFAASLLLGAAWAAWHTVMFLLQGLGGSPVVFALAMTNILVGSVVFSWLYNRTKGSLAIAVLAHAGVHLNNPTHALPGHMTPFVVYTVAIAIAAVAAVAFDRHAWKSATA